MSDRIKRILEYHKIRSFGSKQNAVAQAKDVRITYKELSPDEQADLASIALDRLEGGDKHPTAVLRCLACLQPGSLTAFHNRMISIRLLYPGFMYHDASADAALRIIHILDGVVDARNIILCNHSLIALAWIGDANVQSAFSRWRQQSPLWASSLHVPPHTYSEEAGWELTDSGKRRNLFSKVAYPLVQPNAITATSKEAAVGVRTDLLCPWYTRSLVELFNFGNLGQVLPGQAPIPFHSLTCDVCTAYGHIFSKQEANGTWKWHEANIRPQYLPEDSADWNAFPESPLVMSYETRHFMEAVDWLVPGIRFSQIGGLPTWIQDAEYPRCPDCSKAMTFVGQISNDDFLDLAEGIYYVFACSACGVSATGYQQS